MLSHLFFGDSWLVWVLGPLYLLWIALWLLTRTRLGKARGASAAVRFSSLRALLRLRPSGTLLLRRVVEGLRIVTVGLLLVAMARPQTGRTHTRVRTEGIDIVLAIDTSGSMKALDLDTDREVSSRRNRLQVVQQVVEKFIEKRETDQIGMVVFGEEAFTQCPLTLDHGIVATFLGQLEIGMAGDGTAIGSGLGTAVKRLKDSQAKSKVVILLTDGRNNAGPLTPKKAAEVAKTFGVKVYVIGAGTRGKAPFIVQTPLFGKRVVYEDVPIDEEALKEVATITTGAYFRAEDKTALAKIYDEIDKLERTEIKMDAYQEYNERFAWFLLPALGLLLFETLLLGTRLRKIP